VTLENTCTECHGLDKVLSQLRTEGQWREMAVRMRSKGATMSDDELNALVEYLSQNFGAVETKVNINKASAREIELVTGLRAADSAAIVRYRGAKGPFKGWRDLTKVAGIDKSRLEAARDRITFH
jgi:competence protein ComEA